jgi:hypothetical protein
VTGPNAGDRGYDHLTGDVDDAGLETADLTAPLPVADEVRTGFGSAESLRLPPARVYSSRLVGTHRIQSGRHRWPGRRRWYRRGETVCWVLLEAFLLGVAGRFGVLALRYGHDTTPVPARAVTPYLVVIAALLLAIVGLFAFLWREGRIR